MAETTMRAVLMDGFGGPEVLRLGETPRQTRSVPPRDACALSCTLGRRSNRHLLGPPCDRTRPPLLNVFKIHF